MSVVPPVEVVNSGSVLLRVSKSITRSIKTYFINGIAPDSIKDTVCVKLEIILYRILERALKIITLHFYGMIYSTSAKKTRDQRIQSSPSYFYKQTLYT